MPFVFHPVILKNRSSRLGLLSQPTDNTCNEQAKNKNNHQSSCELLRLDLIIPFSQPRAGRSGRLTSSADLGAIQHVIMSMRSVHPVPSRAQTKNKHSNLSEHNDPDYASLSANLCLGCCVYRCIFIFF